jgi:hypothetical protein
VALNNLVTYFVESSVGTLSFSIASGAQAAGTLAIVLRGVTLPLRSSMLRFTVARVGDDVPPVQLYSGSIQGTKNGAAAIDTS